jgi:DNA-directed RNA polymerase I subunit RPA49
MGEKKRKRAEDGAGRPSKKPSVEKSLGRVRVEHIENKNIVGPVLGTEHVQLLAHTPRS